MGGAVGLRPVRDKEHWPGLTLRCVREDRVLSHPSGLGSGRSLLSVDTSRLGEKGRPDAGEAPCGELRCFPYPPAGSGSTYCFRIVDRLARGPARGRRVRGTSGGARRSLRWHPADFDRHSCLNAQRRSWLTRSRGSELRCVRWRGGERRAAAGIRPSARSELGTWPDRAPLPGEGDVLGTQEKPAVVMVPLKRSAVMSSYLSAKRL